VKVKPHITSWMHAWYLGPFISWEEWNIYQNRVQIGLCLGPFLLYLDVVFWEKDWKTEESEENLPVSEKPHCSV
jgi:hypothetical protein